MMWKVAMDVKTVGLLLVCCAAFAFSAVENEMIYVHLVPHTHDDVGWLKTVDEYFYGSNKSIQDAAVQYILDTVIQELMNDPNKTFSYVEMAFFTRWWNEQSDATKEIVKKLVASKQLEFVNAGWCMNDEASTHYNAIIDQMTLGLQFVYENFGPDARPRVAWHIDPFGHSAEQAAIFAKMGYDGFFFGRIDYDDKHKRLNKTTMEMVWRPSPSLGTASDIFSGVLFSGYGPPPGLCFDMRCSDPPIQDDPNLFDDNLKDRIALFNLNVITQARKYTTNHIMFTMGSDFQYQDARMWYKNLDKLIYYVNKNTSHTGIQTFYSTPSRYVDAVNKAQKTYTVKTDDFFPYADNQFAYWTGYFTSRPALKGYVRRMNSLLQSCKHLNVFGTQLPRKSATTPYRLEAAMGVVQHHDAVSGTEKQHVANDYAKRLHIGQVECEDLFNDVVGTFVSEKSGQAPPVFQFCEYLNVSICPVTETDSFNVVAYNPIGRTTLHYFHFPVHSTKFTVTDDTGTDIMYQVLPVSDSTKAVRRNRGSAPYVLLFAGKLPAMGGMTYFIRPATNGHQVSQLTEAKEPENGEDTVLDNGAFALTFDATTGRLKNMENKVSKISMPVDQQFLWWNSSAGNNKNSSQASGAYIFRPNGTAPFQVNEGNIAKITVVKGPLLQEVRQEFAPWLYQTVRLFNNFPLADFEYTVGPIPIQDDLGKEIISRFSTGLKTDMTWYTDANGREMQKRIRYFRPTWKLNNTEPVAENYYPVNSRIYIRDEDKKVQFTVLNDRSQGGSSLNDGQVELMVHRRCLHDDGRGVGEPLNETGQFGDGLIIRGRHLVLLDDYVNSTFYQRLLGELLMMEPMHAFLSNTDSPSDYMEKYFTNFTGITKELPYNVHLLTLQSLTKGHVLIRLENQYQFDEPPLNQPASVTLDDLFVSFKVTAVTELTLGGNAPLNSVQRLQWKTTNGNPSKHHASQPVKGPDFTVLLNPMEIRTFDVTVQYN